MTFDVHQLDEFVLVGAVVTLAAILAVRVSARAGLPSLLIYLFIGVMLGEGGPFGIPFDDAQLAHALGFGALAVILAEGGLTTDWRQMRSSVRLGLSLATIGVAVSVAVVAVGTHYLLGLPWELAILLGAICSPTDAAAVFSVLRALPLPRRLTGALEAESGLNDAPTVVLVGIISTGAIGEAGLLETSGLIVFELIAGGVIGAADRRGWRVGDAAGGAAVLRPLPARGPVPGVHGVRRCVGGARLRVRRDLRRRAHPRQQRAPAPGGDPLLRRGGGVAGPDRALRDARAAPLAGAHRPRHRRPGAGHRPRAHARGPAAVGRRQQRRAADGAARPGVPVVGRPARSGAHRARHDPVVGGRGGRRGPVRHRLRDGRRLHAADRARPCRGWPGRSGSPVAREPRASRSRRRRSTGSPPTSCR